ncbi:AAA family ATPase [Fructilactobacillus sp. Tb1]|uniref:AAA family ATPase n=1 Tax=Fructilactobacillus sp. Tb1 TaxID=3422304 RepID=UPI003D29777C
MTFEELKEYGQLFYRANYKLDSDLETKTFKIKNIKSYRHEQNDEGGYTDWTDNLVTLYNLLSPVIGKTFGFDINFKTRQMSLFFPLKAKTTKEALNNALPLVDVVDLVQDESSNIATIDISKFNDRYAYASSLYDANPIADLDLNNLDNLTPGNDSKDSSDSDDKAFEDLNLNIEKLDTSVDALKELNDLTGLDEAKKQIKDMIAIAKMNQLREERGLKVPAGISKHMVFVGDPGTGKTTVAKLFGTILAQNHIIAENKFVSTDRSDLVGHYTGTTADRTKKVIESSLGGILFIDEAYQLSHADSPTDFGHEAIDQLIIGMENHRKDLIVILAGYTDRMEEFLNDNPGLRSRIPNRVFFSDYTTAELVEIMKQMMKHEGIVKLKDVKFFDKDVTDFIEENQPSGNARWARNVYQAMLQSQARRVAFMDDPTNDDLTYITNEDITNALANTPAN